LLSSRNGAGSRAQPCGCWAGERSRAAVVDRSCLNGGWNYGNSNMLGKGSGPTYRRPPSRCSPCRIDLPILLSSAV
jgi:hypothetical protein